MHEWDRYWSKKKLISNILFDKVAIFYRKYIIPNSLRYFLIRNYPKNAFLLHAGCGSGKVDKISGIDKKFRLLALDISIVALNINTSDCVKVQGNIINLPLEASSVDGIYNLGVMEHFNEDEIIQILKEFNRVLKTNGKVTLFWPPDFGLSVIFLKAVHFILNNIFRIGIKLHPDELTRIKSYSHVESLCERANFKIVDYYFGLKDLFTYAVVTLEKSKNSVLYKKNCL